MQYDRPLIPATLIKRYKRFLADVTLEDGSEITVHCPNTGSMKRCAEAGSRVWLYDSQSKTRKYQHTFEWVEVDEKYRACVNTARANQLVAEALEQGVIAELKGYCNIKREPKVEDGRLDFLLTSETGERCWVEVKSVTLLEQDNGLGCFPDAVTERGRKHLLRLQALKNQGDRAVLLFCVPHEGIREVTVADHIDPAYGKVLREVQAGGVEIMAAAVEFAADDAGFAVKGLLPLKL